MLAIVIVGHAGSCSALRRWGKVHLGSGNTT
jgi:hypothetical protein